VLYPTTKHFNPSLTASYIDGIKFLAAANVIKLFMKFQVLWFLSLILYILLGHFILLHWQLLRSYSVNVRWMNWYGALVEYYGQGKIKTLREKPGPVSLCPPQIPHGLVCKWTWASGVRGPGLTVRAIYLWRGKWPKNAFYCVDQSQCVVLHVVCVTNTGCVLFERLCNRNCYIAALSEVGYICQISHNQYLDYFL